MRQPWGRPERFARAYAEAGADELIYMDVVASLFGRSSLLDIVSRTASEIFIPLCVGGGLRTLDDIRAALRAGADKVALNTAAIARPQLVREAAERFGSSTVVVSIEAKLQPDGSYEAYTDNGREKTGVNAFDWARRAAELGAGELMITSIDREGTGKGLDLALTSAVADAVSVPVIACGGAGCATDVADAVTHGHADAVSMASILHYAIARTLADDPSLGAEGNREYLKSGRPGFSKIRPESLAEIRTALRAAGISSREHPSAELRQ